MAYAWALEQSEGPTLFALTRQGVPALDRPADFEKEDIWKGGYLVRACEGKPDLVIVASGSEVGLACQGAEQLAERGQAVQVVSMPCLELFDLQPEAEQFALIPDDGTPVVAIEAGRGESFRRFVGRRGLIIGMSSFGESAPAGDLADHFGFTPEKVVARIEEHLGQS